MWIEGDASKNRNTIEHRKSQVRNTLRVFLLFIARKSQKVSLRQGGWGILLTFSLR